MRHAGLRLKYLKVDLLIDKFNFVEHANVSQNELNANKTLIIGEQI